MAETKKNNKKDLDITPNKLSTDENAVFFELNVNPHKDTFFILVEWEWSLTKVCWSSQSWPM